MTNLVVKTIRFNLEPVGMNQMIPLGAKYIGLVPIEQSIQAESNSVDVMLSYDNIEGSKYIDIMVLDMNTNTPFGYSTLGTTYSTSKKVPNKYRVLKVVGMLIG